MIYFTILSLFIPDDNVSGSNPDDIASSITDTDLSITIPFIPIAYDGTTHVSGSNLVDIASSRAGIFGRAIGPNPNTAQTRPDSAHGDPSSYCVQPKLNPRAIPPPPAQWVTQNPSGPSEVLALTSSITDTDLSTRVPFIPNDLNNVDHVNANEKDDDSHDQERLESPLLENNNVGVSISTPTVLSRLPICRADEILIVSSSTDSDNEEAKEDFIILPHAPRSLVLPAPAKADVIKRIGQYTSKQKILLVGEGDFSFTASLAVAFGSASNIIATSLDSQEFLIQNYSKFWTNKCEVETRGGTIIHGVNARTMAKHYTIGKLKFDRIIFNFPHTGTFGKSDADRRKQQNLIGRFISNAKTMICVDGEIHITHKTNGFYLEWNIPKIASDRGLCLIQEMMFRKNKYPGYNTKYGFGGDKDFECMPCKTYKFGWPAEQKERLKSIPNFVHDG